MKIIFVVAMLSVFLGVINLKYRAFTSQSHTWVAPSSADGLINPLKDDAMAISEGKELYNSMCTVCHGSKGKGDGMIGANLNPKPTSFLDLASRRQTDGALYWKITTGNTHMPSYELSLTDEQRWCLVNYIRKLAPPI